MNFAKEIENSNNIKIIPRLKFGVINYREGDIMIPQLDNSKLLNLGWVPKTSLKEGIKKVLKHNT